MSRLLLAAAGGTGLAVALVLRFAHTLRVPEVADPTGEAAAESVSLLVSVPSLAGLAAAAAAGAALGVVLHRRGWGFASTPFLLPGLAVLVYVPGAFRLAPVLASFHGPLLDLLLLAALGTALWRIDRLGGRKTARFRASPRWVAGVAILLYVGLGLRLMRDVGLSGDEPHYLLIAESLIRDFDLRVDDNYFAEDYARFYQGKIGPHLAAGTPYSVHGIGLPLLLLPGFAALGLAGVVATEAILGGLLVAGLYRVAGRIAGPGEALLAAVGFGLTAPALFLAVSSYPELPAALVVVIVMLALTEPGPAAGWKAFGTGVAAGFLPFLHVKFTPLAALLVAAVVLHAWRTRSRRTILPVCVGAGLVALGWLVFLAATVGSLDPTSAYGRQRIFLGNVPLGAAGLLFDQEFGLLPASPFYLLGIAGLAVLARRDRFLGWTAVAVVAAVLLPGAAHPLWTGGNSPPARFLFPALPVLAIAAAALVRDGRGRTGIAPWTASLTAASLAIAGAMVFLQGQPLYLNARDGTGRIWEALSSGWDLTHYLPSLVAADPRSLVIAAAAGLCVLVALVAHARARALPLPPFAAVVLLAALAVDGTGAAPSRELEGRWVTAAWTRAHDLRDSRFALLPSGRGLSAEQALSRLELPLARQRRDGDARHWWSVRYRLPAGDYAVGGVGRRGSALCNGEACFDAGRVSFRTRLGLESFRLRAQRLHRRPSLRLEATRPTGAWALRSTPLSLEPGPGAGGRLHALDDGAYLDPRGFWVKRGASARFAIESDGACARGCALELENGGRANWVEARSATSAARFAMAPWERKSYFVVEAAELVEVTITSQDGFRPSELDPASEDRRELGVLVHAPAFDLTP